MTDKEAVERDVKERKVIDCVYKRELRKEKIRARDSLSRDERAEKSERIAQRVLDSEEFKAAGTVMIYNAVRGEVSLSALISAPESAGKRLVYPLCVSKTEMVALLPSGEGAWKAGSFGIMEPAMERSEQIPPEDIDLVVCPCTAFDESGKRIGMGGGYYDRFLPKCVNAKIVAVAFECQKAERVPTDERDMPMQAVFTEEMRYN